MGSGPPRNKTDPIDHAQCVVDAAATHARQRQTFAACGRSKRSVVSAARYTFVCCGKMGSRGDWGGVHPLERKASMSIGSNAPSVAMQIKSAQRKPDRAGQRPRPDHHPRGGVPSTIRRSELNKNLNALCDTDSEDSDSDDSDDEQSGDRGAQNNAAERGTPEIVAALLRLKIQQLLAEGNLVLGCGKADSKRADGKRP